MLSGFKKMFAKLKVEPTQDELNVSLLNAVVGSVGGGTRTPDIEWALQDGADPNARDQDKNTALHRATGNIYICDDGHNDRLNKIVVALLEAGAEVDALNKNKETALLHASYRNQLDTVKTLLAAGADLTLKSDLGYTPLSVAGGVVIGGSKGIAYYMQSIADGTMTRPTPEDVGLDMNKRNESLKKRGKPLPAQGEKPVMGPKTEALKNQRDDPQRKRALETGEGI